VLDGAGIVTNRGTITGGAFGGFGVELVSGGTVTNAGTISSIYLGGSGSNRLVLEPGAVQGSAIGASNASNTLELASASTTGALSGLGNYRNFTTVMIDDGAVWDLTDTLARGSTLINNGVLSGALTDDGTLINTGSISGTVALGDGGVLINAAHASLPPGARFMARAAPARWSITAALQGPTTACSWRQAVRSPTQVPVRSPLPILPS
jgi:hypothetical protein